MKSFLFPVAVLASAAAAQTTSTCAADYIVEACLSGERAKLANCQTGDYDCQCNQWKNIITCFNNCPNDPRKFENQGQMQIFCGYASQFPSTTRVAIPASSGSAAGSAPAQTTGNANAGSASPTQSASETGTATTAGAASTSTNSAADLALNAGGVLAAVAAVAAVVL
ncbi:hypothetical protein VTK56DRAFT_6245 [Thermocarpiscus australiensis]